MRFPLWSRLFIAFGLLSIAGVLALTVSQRLSFQRDFLAYINENARAQVQSGARELARRYVQYGDWSFLRGRPRLFEAILRGDQRGLNVADLPPPDEPRGEFGRGESGRGGPPKGERSGPPGKGDGFGPRDRPPPGERYADRPGGPGGERGPMGGLREAPPAKRISALDINTRIVLLGTNGRLIIGNPSVPLDSPRFPIVVDGQEVGVLLFADQPKLESDFEIAFARSQNFHTGLAAAGVLIGALLAAWVLARWLLAPVNILTTRMQQLAAGNFNERIVTNRRDELGDLARNYNQLAETLSRNQNSRRAWGADIAHELRTPVAILRGEIQALEDGVRPLTREAMSSLQAECVRLTTLIEDLYQLALSDAGALEYRFAEEDLNAFIHDNAHEYQQLLSAAKLNLRVETSTTPLIASIDPRRLGQLFTNLITNSARYTDAPGQVIITTRAEQGKAIITVDDSPPGVPATALPKLFDRLYRVEGSRNRAAGGAGLGLSICKNIAEAHHGTLAAEPSPLGGLRMTLTLPLTLSPARHESNL